MILQIVILSSGYLLMAIIGIAVKIMLKPYSAQMDDSGIKGAGFTIGIFERILIFTFVLTNQYSAISIIFAAKSIARFRELDKRDFAEYYLLGTFTSITFALIVGIFFKLIFGSFIV